MTLPQIRLALEEADRAEAAGGLLYLNSMGAALLASVKAKHDPNPYRKLGRELLKLTS